LQPLVRKLACTWWSLGRTEAQNIEQQVQGHELEDVAEDPGRKIARRPREPTEQEPEEHEESSEVSGRGQVERHCSRNYNEDAIPSVSIDYGKRVPEREKSAVEKIRRWMKME